MYCTIGIAGGPVHFYQTFCTSAHPCPHKIQTFLDTFSSNINKVDNHFKALCDDQINIAKIRECIKGLKPNKDMLHVDNWAQYEL